MSFPEDAGRHIPLGSDEVATRDDVQHVLDQVAAVVWGDLELENGFEDYGSVWTPARYRLNANNSVFVEGIVKRPTPPENGVVICTLPPEASPGGPLAFVCASSGGCSRIDVYPDGRVVFYEVLVGSNAGGYIALNGIAFTADADVAVPTPYTGTLP